MPSTRRMILGHVMSDLCSKMNRTKQLEPNILETPLKRCLNTFDITLLGLGHMIGTWKWNFSVEKIENCEFFLNRSWNLCVNGGRSQRHCWTRNHHLLYIRLENRFRFNSTIFPKIFLNFSWICFYVSGHLLRWVWYVT